ncbi:MAG: putative toxin-antitoxin system toxin component, PIN family [Deltaproteobacteria bacterium]|nr:putative toxin-antitoxin system toxin component, PIN family [Deltaproteobacteria bacterium]
MRIVLDTNVFISGVFFSGPPYDILKAWIDERIQIVISSEILQEYQRVGEELQYRYPEIKIIPILKSFSKNAILISAPSLPHQVCVDPDDDKFLACAVAGNAELIISGDRHLLDINDFQSIKIIKPRMFLDEYL